jgi:hypothetical protein
VKLAALVIARALPYPRRPFSKVGAMAYLFVLILLFRKGVNAVVDGWIQSVDGGRRMGTKENVAAAVPAPRAQGAGPVKK